MSFVFLGFFLTQLFVGSFLVLVYVFYRNTLITS